MKKLATLLLLIVSFFSKSTIAQNITCNAEFNVTYQTLNSVLFTPLMPGDATTTQHYWIFGDGNVSNAVSPLHTYLTTGTYTAEHIIIRSSNGIVICRDSFFRVVQIQTPTPTPCNLVANFTSSATGILSFHFENTSVPLNSTDSIRWTFGDGTFSNDVSPNHTYLQQGTYNVCLRIQQREPNGVLTNCIREICHTIILPSPTTCNLVANFTFAYLAGTINTIQFQNTSVPLNSTDSIRWTFGDGTSSNDINPHHTYTQSGTYTVCLRIQQRDPNGTLTNCIREVCNTIVVQSPTTCTLLANFYSFSDSTVTTPYTVHFVNTTAPLSSTDSIHWTFGDGTSSDQLNPNHTFAQPGTYTVCLRVQKRNNNGSLTNCISEICHQVVVYPLPPACSLVANFYSYRDTTVINIYTYHFENTSVPLNNTDSIRWTFGDGTSSNQVSPNHTYANPGTYNVCLRVQKRNSNGTLTTCISEICHTVVVLYQTTCNLAANFYSYRDSLSTNPYTYHFENTSAPLSLTDSIRWTFGDGSSSNQVSPNHTYANPGTYTVCLRVQKRNSLGTLSTCISEICHTVVVNSVCNIQAHYSWHADSLNHRIIYFTNQTITPSATATAIWNFGDGTTASTWNAVHEYTQPGRYYVCLRVQLSPSCVSYSCDSINVTASEVSCLQQSNFSFLGATGNSQLFYFIPSHINNSWQYTWTFGDGTGSHDITATHFYTQPGNYTACLTVYRNANCASTTCRNIIANYQVNCDSVHVNYNYQADPLIPNKLFFHAVSNFTITDQIWTITRIPANTSTPPVTLHQNNPYYIFHDTGYYNVCLRATTLGGCIKEYCQVIHISQVVTTNTCNLQLYPNPASTSISVNVFLAQPQMIDVYIYNSLNILVKEKHQAGISGNNIVSLAIGDLVAGLYTMKVIHGNDICYAQFVKL